MPNTTGKKIKIGVIGASGYTGADLIRLAACHPGMEISALAANTHAGKPLADVFPHLGFVDAPPLVKAEEVDWSSLDAVFCGLPHGTAQDIIATLPESVKVIDMSADFRLKDTSTYAKWYGREHAATHLLEGAAYGLTEHNREAIRAARLVACPGCYPTATLLALLPLVAAKLVDASDIIVDAKSGVSGAGRSLKQNILFSEAGEGLSPYAIAGHRHAPEIEQEISKAAGANVFVNFTPHLVPMSRGELVTCYVRLAGSHTAADLAAALAERYAGEPFVKLAPKGTLPSTQFVRGSNFCLIGVYADRIPGRAIVVSTIDNLVKGSAGQAVQNFNLMFGFEETAGIAQQPLFP
ncbi:N-acetyl-gamma-glutamyl-phosphate reductase [Rhodomicrobium udaipurense JA643]|uniref:N-acetyl-gamma-glutamyl-phosphate reductase n=1 Tax=Rhodomicrobium udaipurense TaxID=1202716 RepID=A0A8I1KJW6_9HYPH|nr:N-acetyl-gamma-glutamyl-phosphate reductase [Rhodomicrobium udaipurense]KAI94201.1 N-acetyl-gamma-glutamyl-phosphate reductase [Rhodomicrobium udaipurense JA643]MBJ7543354.1 N-acetyl-gamma-glutamyl-phosphate reductase [Rhodomicrobium udaipurense]